MAEREEPAEHGRANDGVDPSAWEKDWHGHAHDVDGDTAEVIGFPGAVATETDVDLLDVDELGEEPVDLGSVQADDALLDALGGTNPDVPARYDNRAPDLETLLITWRRDVDAAPIGDLVDIDAAVAAIAEGSRPSKKRRRHLIPLATAAAVLMIAFTGVGLAARQALPGDMLWGVSQVLYSDHARVVQAATSARIELANANAAFLLGDRVAAEAALRRAQEQMREVDAANGLAELRSAQASLAAKVEGADSPSAASSSSRPHGTSSPPQPVPATSQPLEPPVSTSSGPPSASTSPTPSSASTTSTSSSTPPSTTGGLFGGANR